jgi:hypothetical protein
MDVRHDVALWRVRVYHVAIGKHSRRPDMQAGVQRDSSHSISGYAQAVIRNEYTVLALGYATTVAVMCLLFLPVAIWSAGVEEGVATAVTFAVAGLVLPLAVAAAIGASLAVTFAGFSIAQFVVNVIKRRMGVE